MGARGPPPGLFTPDWYQFPDALELAYQRFGDARLACRALDQLERRLHRKWVPVDGPPFNLHSGDTVEADIAIEWRGNNQVFSPGWRDEIEYRINGEPQDGWLFVLKQDVIKGLGLVSPEPDIVARSATKSGRPTEHDWSEIAAEVVQRTWKNSRIIEPKSENSLAEDIASWATKKWGKAPAISELRQFVKHALIILRALSK
jgi:hypothetical protein